MKIKTTGEQVRRSGVIKFCLMIFLFFSFHSQAQTRQDVWRMGYWQAGPVFTMNFHGGVLQIDSLNIPSPMSFYSDDAAICDVNGNLLFYSNGIYIANALHDTMLNGGELNPGTAANIWRDHGLPNVQISIVLPDPADSNLYYMFYTSEDYSNFRGDTLLMAKIDMRLDNGLGAVVVKNYPVSADGYISGQLTAAKHANGRDWWLICHGFNNDIYYSTLISTDGIHPSIAQNIGNQKSYYGQAVISPNGEMYASYDSYYNLELMDFDRCSGLFSNYRYIDTPDSGITIGCAFSPNSKVLYVSSRVYLYQLDVTAADISSTMDTVAIWDGFADPVSNTFELQQLAPDHKIYITGWGSVKHLHVINYPDSLGLACDVQQHAIALPGYNDGTMPNYPNYELGAKGGTVCDSLPTQTSTLLYTKEGLEVFPNPVQSVVYISQFKSEKIIAIELVNALGEHIQIHPLSVASDDYFQINMSGLPSGIYEIDVRMSGRYLSKKVVKL